VTVSTFWSPTGSAADSTTCHDAMRYASTCGCASVRNPSYGAILEAILHVGDGSQGREVGMEDMGLTCADDGGVTNDPKRPTALNRSARASIPQGPMSSSPARRLRSIERR
jgi:hypothetical protein